MNYKKGTENAGYFKKMFNASLKTRDEIYNAMKPMRNIKFGMLDGQLDAGYVTVGLGVSMIHSIRPCKEIIDDITQDFKP